MQPHVYHHQECSPPRWNFRVTAQSVTRHNGASSRNVSGSRNCSSGTGDRVDGQTRPHITTHTRCKRYVYLVLGCHFERLP